MVHVCNPIPQKAEAKESEIQSHSQLQCKCKTFWCYPRGDIQAGSTKNKEFQKHKHFRFTGVLVGVSTAVKRNHDQGNFYRKFS